METSQAYPFDRCPRMELSPRYREVREREAVTAVVLDDGSPAVLVTRHADIQRVLTEQDVFSRAAADGLPGQPSLGGLMLAFDGAEHARTRTPAARALTPRRVAEMLPLLREHAAAVAAELAGAARIDFAEVSLRYSLDVIADLLDIAIGERDWFVDRARSFLGTYGRDASGHARLDLGLYLYEQVQQRRAKPGDDLLSTIVKNDPQLTDDDLGNIAIGLLVGGMETTSGILTQAALWLLRHRDRLAELITHPERIAPGAVHEFLRVLMVSARDGQARRTVSGTEIGGVPIAAGTVVFASMAAGNRDPRVYLKPEDVDFTRFGDGGVNHLAFGWGPHRCLGASLAVASLGEILTVVVRALPDFEVAAEEWKEHATVRGLARLELVRRAAVTV